MDILAKCVIFINTPAENGSVENVVPWNFLKNLIYTIWNSFHGGASRGVCLGGGGGGKLAKCLAEHCASPEKVAQREGGGGGASVVP